MKCVFFTIFLFASKPSLTGAWQRYAEPLTFPNMNSGPFVFDMKIELTLTMNYLDADGSANMVDYSPTNQSWSERNMRMSMPCNMPTPLQNDSELNSVIVMDGLHKRVITINGATPAKPMIVPLNAEVVMRVKNNLMVEGVSIHLHGMDKKNLWFTDGVAFVQQCPIPAGSTYSYRFIADTPGTLWIHGHMASDRGSGLLGAFIVTTGDESVVADSNGARVVPSRQYVAMIQEWMRPSMQAVSFNYMVGAAKWMYDYDDTSRCFPSTRSYDGSYIGGSMPISAIVVNDKGWHNQTEVKTKPWSLPLETFRIKPNENILIRFINGGTAQLAMVSIESHRMTVVAADGRSVKPIDVDMLVLSSGERYDVLIKGVANPARKRYHVILETLEHYDLTLKKMIEPSYGIAMLEYESVVNDINQAPDLAHQKDCSFTKPCTVLNCPFAQFPKEYPYKCTGAGELRSLVPPVDSALISDQGFENGYQEFFLNWNYNINGWAFTLPTGVPYFYNGREHEISTWCDPSQCSTGGEPGCQCFYHLNITLGSVVQITFYNYGQGPYATPGGGQLHPIHIHGTHYYLVKTGFPHYDNDSVGQQPNDDLPCTQNAVDQTCNNLEWTNKTWLNGRVGGMNTYDPSFRDTVILPPGGYVVIRFRADNPGWFYAHCHIMLHQMGGTAFAIKIGEHSQIPPPPDNFPHSCGVYEQPSLGASQSPPTPSPTTPPTTSSKGIRYSLSASLILCYLLCCSLVIVQIL